MSSQQNSVVSVIPGITLNNSVEKGVYQLQTLTINPNQLEKSATLIEQNSSNLLVGAFQTLHGNLNTSILLWKHPTLAAASNLVSQQMKSNSYQSSYWYWLLIQSFLLKAKIGSRLQVDILKSWYLIRYHLYNSCLIGKLTWHWCKISILIKFSNTLTM